MIAAIRIRGRVDVKGEIKDTLNLLRLRKKHVCSIYPNKKEIINMLKKVENFITWGEINKETLKELILKRGRLKGNKKISEEYFKEKNIKIDDLIDKLEKGEIKLEDVGIKPFFRLRPPKGGFERKGIKVNYKLGGALGYRGEKINELIRRMI